MAERKFIPIPPNGFGSDEDEARWLADTIAMRAAEAIESMGLSATFSTDSLYELLLVSLRRAAKRAISKAKAAAEAQP
jgi:hypothetical protein